MRPLLVSYLVIIGLTSCSHIEFKSEGEIPVFISPVVDHNKYFKESYTHEFYFYGLIPSKFDFNVDDYARAQGFTSVANLTMTTYQSWSDWMKTIFSFGFYAPKTVIFEGFGAGGDDD
tara:strand:+ start:283648 stop:284001 length:354 start_codon:yes stop_codon:yes gene_type:complete